MFKGSLRINIRKRHLVFCLEFSKKKIFPFRFLDFLRTVCCFSYQLVVVYSIKNISFLVNLPIVVSGSQVVTKFYQIFYPFLAVLAFLVSFFFILLGFQNGIITYLRRGSFQSSWLRPQ